MQEHDMRNQILADLINKMHMRMADKMYPDDTHGDMEAAAAGMDAHDDASMPKTETAPIMEVESDEPSDEELDMMMKDMK